MKKLIVAGLLLAAMPARAQDSRDWTTRDTVMQGLVLTSLVLDRNQTVQIARDPWKFEKNPILGRRPSRQSVDAYFLTFAFLHTVTMIAVPNPYRNILQGVTIGVEAGTVCRNYRIGWSMRF